MTRPRDAIVRCKTRRNRDTEGGERAKAEWGTCRRIAPAPLLTPLGQAGEPLPYTVTWPAHRGERRLRARRQPVRRVVLPRYRLRLLERATMAGALALGLVACTAPAPTGSPYVETVRRVGLACDAYAEALQLLAVERRAGRLDASTVMRVQVIVNLASPICETRAIPITAGRDVLDELERAVRTLQQIRRERLA